MRDKGHSCLPDRVGQCTECRRLRLMSRREFMEWFAAKYSRSFCERNPEHLIGSWAHQKECEKVSA